jgi:starch phosphorylase
MVAVGLLYRDGYFQQFIDKDGQQHAIYQRQKWEELPVAEVRTAEGKEIKVHLEFPGRIVAAKLWMISVGRIPIYMLDTDLPENMEGDRALTARLYGGDQEVRIQQELLLGIGGTRALRALRKAGLLPMDPTVYHLNEGHPAFLSLERLRELMQHDGLSQAEATEVIRATSIFTTHTPVPAGHDRFPIGLVEKYFRNFYESIQLSRSEFIDFGYEPMPDGQQLFSMTILALHFSAMANGVSELHGEVSRAMMAPIWRDVPASEVPIGHITNGVHTRTWMSFDLQNLFDKYVGPNWRDAIPDPKMWAQALDNIPDAELWATKRELKAAFVRFIHTHLRDQHARFGEMPDEIEKLDEIFNAKDLTIGFARRFATYKRATLIFRDPARLARIMNDPNRPIQLVFAGKAHPADIPGQQFIRRIIEFSRQPEFRNRLVFLENYDMNIGRRMTSGVDLWLNNPRRPLEASGTSGMKVPLNAGLNCSILDGWWPEAYRVNPLVGWALGREKHYDSEDQQDAEDAEHLYRTLENEIAPLYYKVNANGIPEGWIARVKESMKTVAPRFNTDRMVSEYTERYYLWGSTRGRELVAENYAAAREYARHKAELRKNWGQTRLKARVLSTMPPGAEVYSVQVKDRVEVEAEVFLGAIPRKDVQVEIYLEDLRNGNGGLPAVDRVPMTFVREEVVDGLVWNVYKGSVERGETGDFGFTVRLVPNDPKLFHPHELGLVRWAQNV